jgi:hypothetical protein
LDAIYSKRTLLMPPSYVTNGSEVTRSHTARRTHWTKSPICQFVQTSVEWFSFSLILNLSNNGTHTNWFQHAFWRFFDFWRHFLEYIPHSAIVGHFRPMRTPKRKRFWHAFWRYFDMQFTRKKVFWSRILILPYLVTYRIKLISRFIIQRIT